MALPRAAFADKIQIKEMFMNKEEVWACFQVLWSFLLCVWTFMNQQLTERYEKIYTHGSWLQAGIFKKKYWWKAVVSRP